MLKLHKFKMLREVLKIVKFLDAWGPLFKNMFKIGFKPVTSKVGKINFLKISQLNIVSIKGYWRGGVNLILVEELYENRQ